MHTFSKRTERTIVDESTFTVTRENAWRVPTSARYNEVMYLVIPCSAFGRWIGPPSVRAALSPSKAIESAIRNEDGYGFAEIPSKAFVIAPSGLAATRVSGAYYSIDERSRTVSPTADAGVDRDPLRDPLVWDRY